MIIKPLNNLILAKVLELPPKEMPETSIIIPNEHKTGRFIKLEVLDIGDEVKVIVKGDKVIANNLFEVVDPKQKDVGFINSRDVLGIIKNE